MKTIAVLVVFLLGAAVLSLFVRALPTGGRIQLPYLEGGRWVCGELCGPQTDPSPIPAPTMSSPAKDLTCPPARVVRRGVWKAGVPIPHDGRREEIIFGPNQDYVVCRSR